MKHANEIVDLSNVTKRVIARHGTFDALETDKPIYDALIQYGEWAQIEIDFLIQFFSTARVIIDAGSHIGLHACAFAALAPKSSVVALEPQPQLFELLLRNVNANCRQVQCINKGLASEIGRAHMAKLQATVPINAGSSKIHADKEGIEVDVTTLDALNLERVDFVKLDIEGHESQALRGAQNFLRKCRPVIFCEVNTVGSGLAVLDAIQQHGYLTYFVSTAAYNPNNHNRNPRNFFGYAHETGLLLLPADTPPPQKRQATRLTRVQNADELAGLILSAARYGDTTPFDRDAAELRRRLVLVEQQLTANAAPLHMRDTETSELMTVTSRFDSIEAVLRKIEQTNVTLNETVQRQNDLYAHNQETIKTLALQNDALLRGAELLRSKINEYDSQLNRSLSNLEQLQQQFSNETSSHESTRRELEITRLNTSRLSDTVSELRKALESAENQLNSLQTESDATKAENSYLQRKLDHQLELFKHATEQNTELNSRVAQITGKLVETQNRLGMSELRYEGILSALRTERRDLQSMRANFNLEKLSLERNVSELQIEIFRQRQTLELIETSISNLILHDYFVAWARKFSKSDFAQAIRDIQSSGYFDENWYKQQYSLTLKGANPFAHYLLFGANKGLDPAPNFSGKDYLEVNSDVRNSGVNPLLHYARWGTKENRQRRKEAQPTAPILVSYAKKWERPSAPPMSFFHSLADKGTRRTGAELLAIDVIIPVYRSYDDTLACIASVLTSTNSAQFELIVIDDCSPEAEISIALKEIAAIGLITLLRNDQNLGFVGTVNKGMSLHPNRDVILLNSDTLVFNDWVDRILWQANSSSRVATVTPFTNNGTICSYPKFCQDNNESLECSFEQLDRLFSRVNNQKHVEVPTGVGFCMFIKRQAIMELGLFDEATFGKGYGEENDFCMRAAQEGWKNLHALDVFVFHSGETSFGESAQQSKTIGLQALLAKHPSYSETVTKYIKQDPARQARIAVDIARLQGQSPNKRAIFCFSHSSGGGVERYLNDYAAWLKGNGVDLLVLTPSVLGSSIGTLRRTGDSGQLPNLYTLNLVDDAALLRSAAAQLCVESIEIHSAVGWTYKSPVLFRRFAEVCSLPYSVMLHDFVSVCPQINLINESGTYCEEQGILQCNRCVALNRTQPRAIHPDISDPSRINISIWRQMYKELLEGATEVFAPSHDTAIRINRYFPDLKIKVTPHREPVRTMTARAPRVKTTSRFRVGAIGAIGPHKGSRILLGCAKDAVARKLPLTYSIIGYSDIDEELRSAGVTITGKYDEKDVFDLIASEAIDLAFLPSVWPETYSYTLSIAMAARLPVCTFEIGAPIERLAEYGMGLLVPVRHMRHPELINDSIIRFLNSVHRDAAQK